MFFSEKLNKITSVPLKPLSYWPKYLLVLFLMLYGIQSSYTVCVYTHVHTFERSNYLVLIDAQKSGLSDLQAPV